MIAQHYFSAAVASLLSLRSNNVKKTGARFKRDFNFYNFLNC